MRSKRFVLVCVGAPENDNCALLLKKAGLGGRTDHAHSDGSVFHGGSWPPPPRMRRLVNKSLLYAPNNKPVKSECGKDSGGSERIRIHEGRDHVLLFEDDGGHGTSSSLP
jgi:hypothetical protein